MNYRILVGILGFCWLIQVPGHAQFVFKEDAGEKGLGTQYGYAGGSVMYAQGLDIGSIYTVGAGLEMGLLIGLFDQLTIEPRGYIHYFANYPTEYNYNDNLWFWNFGALVAYQIPLNESSFSISPLVGVGYMGGRNVISFPYNSAESIRLMKFNGVDVSLGARFSYRDIFLRVSYEWYLNSYELNPDFLNPPSGPMPPSKPYGPVYSGAVNDLNMNYVNFTLGYLFELF
ncbi:hypothetical protein QWY31_07590 [Cytophagales bacterium LB-30]|uniref:Outer membrane protein beta-barrel domain-containing protein n=1 Tax=Shiella aurantiaca TaxID=3058365 RepID=A0ABT8F513_9BACT|nr:hypothetical protein [Shiella aurantiaca]MDN4165359.1 hypothetical protein [Shiella aurantiaca]